ncbi:UbiH/UbiF/VisC/COQ6 family ubiquinone biosynthesis hydroxylase [Cognatishimia activa]|uniref:2-octaprenyl-3-methyl-6-methoxy-1,4-benzoquinol hydroxylase n=1 Tax=Cognatishimia activa TaxID=1715691 RepID=A0A0N7MB46_9RHOB|nr:UbiH/UbiF/VisC/COQ6 family ubiquinone biosynthesis hydroxylase [Cognatishimia activa]CUI56413.1 2-octaprenyl-3-methyl-6-methoxy-1,4-benzoquinol hydroxylase [Cognatishimia activa]CUK24392.1 2-octaprenyl-3-methyl-6-methoxy-1,4-benzoquinol hydroxylase [Cognatishimia activa]
MDNLKVMHILKGMEYDCDILIAGGGLNGPALALGLAQKGFSVTMVDARPARARAESNFDGRGYAMALTSKRLLDALGVWDAVAKDSQPMLDIKVSDGRAGDGPSPFSLHFDHAELEEGPMGFMVEDRFLYRAFLDAVEAEPKVTTIYEDSVVAQDIYADGVTISLESGKALNAQLLIGCDGRGSGVAQRADIKRTGWEYPQTALVCAIEHELPHNGVAHQFFMPPGPLAILPLTGNRSSIVWTETAENAAAIHALGDEDYIDVLKPRFGDFLGNIALAGARFTYPLGLTVANNFVCERIALVGDAAHGMHPIAGQGLNAGLRDVAAMIDVLDEARKRGEDIASLLVLKRYEEWRRFDTHALVAATDLSNKIFSNDNPILRLGRDVGMGVINRLPFARRAFMREAAGLSGDLPSMMR